MALVPADKLGNELADAGEGSIALSAAAGLTPAVASIYQLDGLVRRAPSLQLTADARQAASVEGVTA